MRRVIVLGSTGSIGVNALDVVSRFSDDFKVVALSVNSNVTLLEKQIKKFRPESVCVVNESAAEKVKSKVRKYKGEEGLCRMVRDTKADILVMGIVGSSALLPLLNAIPRVKRIALANKEALVMAGGIIMEMAGRNGTEILPVDSEHSAIFQCLAPGDRNEKCIKNIYLTGSGGPLLKVPRSKFRDITPTQAVNHPKWKMGRKISVDSATMMNKGLEVIEAHHLFGLGVDKISVVIHPETIVHSMVEFIDGSTLAQMGTCDMRTPIQYALTYPLRKISSVKGIAFSEVKTLNFYKPDLKKFPCLEIAYGAAGSGRTYPCVLNASNEIAVAEFLKGKIKFTGIPKVIEKVLGAHKGVGSPGLEDILESDEWARRKTKEILSVINY